MLNMDVFLFCGKLSRIECTNSEGKFHADSECGQG